MFSSSPKRLNFDTCNNSANYVTIGNAGLQGISTSFTSKSQTKNQQTLAKSNLISRYSSQEDLKSYARPKLSNEEIAISPKSQQDFIFKKFSFIPRKIKGNQVKESINPRYKLTKRNTNIVIGEKNFTFFKSPAFDSKVHKNLKQTSSTNSTDNMLTGARSQKLIPSFLKNGFQNRKKIQQGPVCKNRQIYSLPQQLQLSIQSFDIIEKLGEGKFGSVYLAVQKETGFIFALKAVQKKRVLQQNFLTQFIRQLKIQSYLQHPNIAKAYGFFHDQNYFYSILQLGQGGQLYDIIKNGQTLSEETTSYIISSLLDAISYIHEKKILHRDIKPQNIVLVHGIVKLCDFGWAVYKKGQLRSTFCGTPLYLSPELLNGEKYDEKVDLWAIGILAFQLHLGSSPFNIQSQQDLLKIVTNQIEYPQDYHVSKNFKQFIAAVLKKDPKQRLEAKKLLELRFIKRYKELQTCEELCQ